MQKSEGWSDCLTNLRSAAHVPGATVPETWRLIGWCRSHQKALNSVPVLARGAPFGRFFRFFYRPDDQTFTPRSTRFGNLIPECASSNGGKDLKWKIRRGDQDPFLADQTATLFVMIDKLESSERKPALVLVNSSSDRSAPMTHSERRTLGRFDTPRPLAQALADWAIRDASDRVLEPSCGGGVIIKSAVARLTEIGAEHPQQRIRGCDIDSRALDETARGIASSELKLIHGNFLALTLKDFDEVPFNVVLGNPPYVRLHTMDETTRIIARNVLTPPDKISAKASLWAYFPIHAFKFLAAGGRMGWILPEIVLHAEYGKELLSWAAQKFERCIAVSLRERCFLGDGAKERVVVLLLSGAGVHAKRGVEMIEYTTADECVRALPELAHAASRALPQLNGHAVPHLVSVAAAGAAQTIENSKDVTRLGAFAEIKIGVVTGDNRFFVLTEEQRIAAKLHPRHFQRAVRKFDDLGTGFHLAKIPQTRSFKENASGSWLLRPSPLSADQQLAKYLNQYTPQEIAKNRTMAKRSHWQVPLLGEVPDAFFRCMGKVGPRVVLNEAKSYCTNTIHCLFFKRTVSTRKRRAICLSLHSSYSQLYAEFEGRQYGSGVLKFEPSEAKRLVLALNEPLIEALSSAWPNLARVASRSGWQTAVGLIDNIVASHCPQLAKSLSVDAVHTLLTQVRDRRNSIYLGTDS